MENSSRLTLARIADTFLPRVNQRETYEIERAHRC